LAVEKYLAGDGAGATACLTRAKPSVPGNIAGPHTRFFEALLHAEQARAGGPGAAAALAELEADEAQFGQWASLSPRTFGYLHALVAAELCASTGDDRQALTWYEQASKLARDERSLLHEALANELAGEHAERLGWERIAQHHYFENASAAYARWGAARKAAHVAARIREPLEHQRSAPVDPQDTHGTGHVRTDSFDAIALAKATQAISGEIVLSRLMARLMQIAIEQAGAERGFLLLLRNGELWVECAAGSKADSFKRFRFDSAGPAVTPATATRETPVSLPHAIVDFVLQAREKVLLTRAARPGRFSSDPYVGRHRPQSILCMPLIRQGELIGLLYLENRLTADVFHDDQVQLLEMLSTQAAISLENARLYEELEERVRDRTRRLEDSLRTIQENQAKIIEAERRAAVAHLESELAIAQRIQTSILPRELSVAGMEIAAAMATATEVGGDYYDILPTQDGGCWLGIGDVCGHGLNAGLVMLMVQSGLASLMRSDAWVDPATLLCLLNRAVYDNVHRRLERDDYATLALFRFFPEGRFLFAGAHEDILIWRSCSQQCERIETLGTWIGARQDIESQTKSREGRLAEGDVMVLYTDGIVEARRANREQFGIGRTTTIVEQQHAQPAAEICRRLLDQAQAWAVEREDDQTVVVVRRGARR